MNILPLDQCQAAINVWDKLNKKQQKIVSDSVAYWKKESLLSDYEEFAKENIKIVDKNGEQINFTHNSIQKKINDTVKETKAKGKPVRIIVLKARQEGVSTNEQGRMIYNTTTKKNRTGLIVAHEVGATTKIFSKAKYMYDNLPAEYKPLQKASNAKELIFDRPSEYKGAEEGLNSKISVQVAGSVGIGRGDTIFYAHLSEYAFWPSPDGKDKKTQLSGILQAVPKTAETEVIIESTANGHDEYKELWDDAVNGNNEWIPLFFAWHDHETYRMEIETDEERQAIKESINEYERDLINRYNLTFEQIKWYRWTLKNDCNGNHNMMKQENPSFPEEAFIFSGTPVFNSEKIQKRIDILRKSDRKVKYGKFEFEWNNPEYQDFIKNDSIRLVECDEKYAYIRIYEEPLKGYPYTIGGDTKGEGKDSYAATARNNATGNRAATLKMDISNSKPYTWQIYCMGVYYNNALVGIEMNFNTAPIEELERLRYPFQYQRQKYDDVTGTYQRKLGWKTDGITRPLIIDKEVFLVEENLGVFNDIETLQQMLTFVDKNGRPDAMSGKHDDLLFSDMIAEEIKGQQTTLYHEEKPEQPKKLLEKLGIDKNDFIRR